MQPSDTGFLSLFSGFSTNKAIKEHEYINFFVGRQYAAITAIADSLSGLNWRLANNKDQEIQHEYLDYVTPELIHNIVVFMKMTGTAYVRKIKNKHTVLGLSMLLPWNITAKVDNS